MKQMNSWFVSKASSVSIHIFHEQEPKTWQFVINLDEKQSVDLAYEKYCQN